MNIKTYSASIYEAVGKLFAYTYGQNVAGTTLEDLGRRERAAVEEYLNWGNDYCLREIMDFLTENEKLALEYMLFNGDTGSVYILEMADGHYFFTEIRPDYATEGNIYKDKQLGYTYYDNGVCIDGERHLLIPINGDDVKDTYYATEEELNECYELVERR